MVKNRKVKMILRRLTIISLLIIMSTILSACYTIFSPACSVLGDNGAHCYQWIAVHDNNPSLCEAITAPGEFAKVGSNPPRDKCYLMIAERTGDRSLCNNIKGGWFSYTKEECLSSAGSKMTEAQRTRLEEEQRSASEEEAPNTEQEDDEVAGAAYDSECDDPTFLSKCVDNYRMKICVNKKPVIKYCLDGCFEGACRDGDGVTKDEYDKTIDDSIKELLPFLKDDEETKQDDNGGQEPQEELKTCPLCLPEERCINGECVPKKECDKDSDCQEKEICVAGLCEAKPESDLNSECESDDDCGFFEKCSNGFCIDNDDECFMDLDCPSGKICADGKCVEDRCDTSSTICEGKKMISCNDGKIVEQTCLYGCEEGKCLTKEDAEKKQEENEKCETKCLTENKLQLCEEGLKSTVICEYGCDDDKCKPKDCAWWDIFCKDVNDDIEDKVADDVKTLKDAASSKYMELLQKEIENTKDPAKKRGLIEYSKFLKKGSTALGSITTTADTLKEMKRIFIDTYDPSMDIENMPVDKILQKGLFESLKDKIWPTKKNDAIIELEDAEDTVAVYEKMLERQSEIDFLKKKKLDRLGSVIAESAKEKAVGALKNQAEDIAKTIAGKAFLTVGIMDKALSDFQDEAKKQSYAGLARAYNRARRELEKAYPDLDDEAIHKLAVKELKDNPYQFQKGRTFIKFGNLLECNDPNNPLCADQKVFWTAAKKTYDYKNKKRLFDRSLKQIDRHIAKTQAHIREIEKKIKKLSK